MTLTKFFVSAAAMTLAAPAIGAVVVYGSSPAGVCYRAAESQLRPSADQRRQCDIALATQGLGLYETVATHVNRGVLRVRIGDRAGALADFDRAIALDADEAEAYLNKAGLLVRSGDHAAAVPLFSKALALSTRKPAYAYYGRGVANEQLGDAKSAYLDYRRASDAAPEWRLPRREMARFTVRRAS